MAKPNYSFEKRQRELARKKKQEEKRQRKAAEKDDKSRAPDADTEPGSAVEAAAMPSDPASTDPALS